MRRPVKRRLRLLLALGASAGLHLAVLSILVRSSDPPTPPPPAPPVQVTLLRPPTPADQPAPPPAAVTSDRRSANEFERTVARNVRGRPVPAAAGVLPTLSGERPPAAMAGPTSPLPSPPSSASPAAPAKGVSSDLRRALQANGCDPFSRDPAERERCRDRATAARSTPRVALSAAHAAAEDAERASRIRIPGSEGYQNRSPPCREPCVRFGYIPPASPVIPPSTLRGDDDALRPKPRP